MIVEPDRKTRQRKNCSAVSLSAEISFSRHLWELPFVLFSVVKKNATQSTVMRVINKRKHHTFFHTRFVQEWCVRFACA